jgi:phage-related protein
VKKLICVGSSYKDLKEFPPPVRQAVGYALFFAQNGKIHEHAKVLSSMGSAGIQEVRENDKSGTYRVIYTVETPEYVFVSCLPKEIEIRYCYTKAREGTIENPSEGS